MKSEYSGLVTTLVDILGILNQIAAANRKVFVEEGGVKAVIDVANFFATSDQ